MTREEKIKLAIEKGFTYNEITGKIYSRFGREIKSKTNGYIDIAIRDSNKQFHLYGHQFAFYYKYKKIVEQIDHKDGDRTNNKIDNLREVTHRQNTLNKVKVKGYYFNKNRKKYVAEIGVDYKRIYLGYFNTEQEARQAYLDAKKIYHII
jgi:hypothetical protein